MNYSLGKITVPSGGNIVRITNNQVDPTALVRAHSFLIEVLPTNTGKVYIGANNLNRTTLVGVFAILPPPTTNMFPSFSSTISFAPNPFNVSSIFIDVDIDGEGVVASIIQA